MMRSVAIVTALLMPALAAPAERPQGAVRVGDTYEITSDRESTQQGPNGSDGSSTDRDAITERVIALREDGIELEYGLRRGAKAEDRAQNWQFPVRVFKPFHGPMQLLNRAELEGRVDGWLRAAHWTRAICGHWIFTWNAFRIDCDPDTVIEILAAFDMGPDDLRDGSMFEVPHASEPAPLRRTRQGPEGSTFVVSLPLDPEVARRERAQGDAVVAEILGRSPILDAIAPDHAAETISGTISITLETDAAGRARRRVEATRAQIRGPSGVVETDTVTRTLVRRFLSRRPF
jgi:hypothetical protein